MIPGGKQGTGQRGANGEKWDNCNNIINKIYKKDKNQICLKFDKCIILLRYIHMYE